VLVGTVGNQPAQLAADPVSPTAAREPPRTHNYTPANDPHTLTGGSGGNADSSAAADRAAVDVQYLAGDVRGQVRCQEDDRRDSQWLGWLKNDRVFDPLRSEERFRALLEKLGFEGCSVVLLQQHHPLCLHE